MARTTRRPGGGPVDVRRDARRFRVLRSAMTMNFQVDLPGRGVEREGAGGDRSHRRDVAGRRGRGSGRGGRSCSAASASPTPSSPRSCGGLSATRSSCPRWPPAYAQAVAALPAYQEWAEAARAENDFFAADEPYRVTPAHPRLAEARPCRIPTRLSRALVDAAFVCDFVRVRELLAEGATPMPATTMAARPSSRRCWAAAWACWALLLEAGADVERPGQGRLDGAALRRPGAPARDGPC